MTEPKVVTVTPAGGAFSLWVGDPTGGDQAGMAIALDRGPRQQSLELGLGPVKPLHEALDKTGDAVGHARQQRRGRAPAPERRRRSAPRPRSTSSLPGGTANDPNAPGQPPAPVLGPGDVAVDAHGIVWVTLTLANADRAHRPRRRPRRVGSHGIKKCATRRRARARSAARRSAPVGGAAPLTRLPLQMKVRDDGQRQHRRLLHRAERRRDRRAPRRSRRQGRSAEQHFPCVCMQPLGIALAPNGDIWYSEGTSNRLGRMTPRRQGPVRRRP